MAQLPPPWEVTAAGDTLWVPWLETLAVSTRRAIGDAVMNEVADVLQRVLGRSGAEHAGVETTNYMWKHMLAWTTDKDTVEAACGDDGHAIRVHMSAVRSVTHHGMTLFVQIKHGARQAELLQLSFGGYVSFSVHKDWAADASAHANMLQGRRLANSVRRALLVALPQVLRRERAHHRAETVSALAAHTGGYDVADLVTEYSMGRQRRH